MEKYNDFRQKFIDLKDKLVRICYIVDTTERLFEHYGWIRKVGEYTLDFENISSKYDTPHLPIKTSFFNLSAIIIYEIDEIKEDVDLVAWLIEQEEKDEN